MCISVVSSHLGFKKARGAQKQRGLKLRRKSGGLFVPEAQDVYIIFFIYPIGFLASFNQNIAISKAFIPF
ncbi:hypothetical protein Hanom_Chr17g01585631 [Helianthus anomalus]